MQARHIVIKIPDSGPLLFSFSAPEKVKQLLATLLVVVPVIQKEKKIEDAPSRFTALFSSLAEGFRDGDEEAAVPRESLITPTQTEQKKKKIEEPPSGFASLFSSLAEGFKDEDEEAAGLRDTHDACLAVTDYHYLKSCTFFSALADGMLDAGYDLVSEVYVSGHVKLTFRSRDVNVN
jgi:hypothetical protein